MKVKVKDHEHEWVFWKETKQFIWFKCAVRGCKETMMIDKLTAKDVK